MRLRNDDVFIAALNAALDEDTSAYTTDAYNVTKAKTLYLDNIKAQLIKSAADICNTGSEDVLKIWHDLYKHIKKTIKQIQDKKIVLTTERIRTLYAIGIYENGIDGTYRMRNPACNSVQPLNKLYSKIFIIRVTIDPTYDKYENKVSVEMHDVTDSIDKISDDNPDKD